SFLRDRQAHDHEATAMMKAQFMSLWDGFATTNDKIIVMGATNRPQDVDPAILRRMSARFAIPMPSEKQREQILRKRAVKVENSQSRSSEVNGVRNVATIASQEPSGPSMKTKVPGPASMEIKKKMDPLH
ncbi:hypothetical protein TELCIR_15697, partial [Teladorsagia circumcincta]